ncbi:GNAT family N-acetyltransferase [Streptomyces sp. NBC_00237]|uniref:GNAT family N-acetyltransferase n=1 Tax=Streptomyces sp. NBC_00237 TaxID=2975687 RepID=UPI0022511B32|nr:GNAT family N-acetyltransferase [Streptomyces sp. NBC_00237]MCX5207361.1 GNAT family N-acetyltransferase [Streptomyces sp. NBC_00237]
MAAVAEVFIRRLSRWQADQQRESVADLYEATYRDGGAVAPARPYTTDGRISYQKGDKGAPASAPAPVFHDRAAFLDRFAADVQRPGFDMLIASSATVLVGCIYGFLPDRQGSWWYGRHDIAPSSMGQLADSGRVFNVAELMVAPSHRRRGVAEELQERLLVRVDAEHVTTLIESSNTVAKAAYESWHWHRTDDLPAANGRPALEVWSRAPRTPTRP